MYNTSPSMLWRCIILLPHVSICYATCANANHSTRQNIWSEPPTLCLQNKIRVQTITWGIHMNFDHMNICFVNNSPTFGHLLVSFYITGFIIVQNVVWTALLTSDCHIPALQPSWLCFCLVSVWWCDITSCCVFLFLLCVIILITHTCIHSLSV